MNRAQKVAKAQKLRAQGLKLREIAVRMGSKTSTVSAWLADPDLSKQLARRKRYAGKCRECGRATDGSAGYNYAPSLCGVCTREINHEEATARAVAAIQRFAKEHGRPPLSWEWQIERNGWPATNSIRQLFGSWSAGIRAAGFEPSAESYQRISTRVRNNTLRLYEEGVSVVEIARRYGVTNQAIRYRLASAGALSTPCKTRGCLRSAVQHGLCPSHNHLRWLQEKAA